MTAALYQYDNGGLTVFAIMSEKWNPTVNTDWFTIGMSEVELIELDNFEILNSDMNSNRNCKTTIS